MEQLLVLELEQELRLVTQVLLREQAHIIQAKRLVKAEAQRFKVPGPEPILVPVPVKEPGLVVKHIECMLKEQFELPVVMLVVVAELVEQLKQELVEHTRLIGLAEVGVGAGQLMAKHIELAKELESLLEEQLAGLTQRLELTVKLELTDQLKQEQQQLAEVLVARPRLILQQQRFEKSRLSVQQILGCLDFIGCKQPQPMLQYLLVEQPTQFFPHTLDYQYQLHPSIEPSYGKQGVHHSDLQQFFIVSLHFSQLKQIF